MGIALPSHITSIRPTSITFAPTVDVMTVNLFYSNPTLLPVRGFGYLIPRSVPLHQNPVLGLGVLFDSETTHGQDTVPGTKLTVMLGGHWWSKWKGQPPPETEGVSIAKRMLQNHIGIEARPAATLVSLHRGCIPQFSLHHCERAIACHRNLSEYYRGSLRVAGGYSGVGVNDCIRSAYETVQGLVSGKGLTGLEGFLPENDFREYPIQ